MKFVVCGNYGAKNIGDEMILSGLLKMLKKMSPRANITVLSANPKETKHLHKVNAVSQFPSGIRSIFKIDKKTKKAVKECDYFILGGGGLFAGVEKRANMIWGIQAVMAHLYGKPLLILGQSLGKINNGFEKWIIKKVFGMAKFISVRDEYSKNLLKRIGIKTPITVAPDFAFYSNLKTKKEEKSLLLALRKMREDLPEEFTGEIHKFLKWLTKKQKWDIQTINFQEGNYAPDKVLHKKALKGLKNVNIKTPKEIKSSIILGMRLHSIITAIITRKTFIAINYAPKMQAFLKYAGLDEYLININDISEKALITKFQKIQKNKAKIIRQIDLFLEKASKEQSKLEIKLKNFLA